MKAIYFFLFSLCLQAATAQPLQRVAPEQVGMDSRKLMYADEAIETAISNKDIPGAVLAVVEKGNPHCRFDDTHFRSSSLCTGSRARKAVRFSQS